MSFLHDSVHLAISILACAELAALGSATPAASGHRTCRGDAAPMLLAINRSIKRWLPNQTALDAEDEGGSTSAQGNPGLVQLVSETLAVAAMHKADLEYDSNDDDGGEIDVSSDQDLDHFVEETFGVEEHASPKAMEALATGKSIATSTVSYVPSMWNQVPEIRYSHNCYMYALNDFSFRSQKSCAHRRVKLVNLMAKSEENKRKEEGEFRKACKRFFHKPGYYFQNGVLGRKTTDIWSRQETSCKFMLPMIAADSPAVVWNNVETNRSLTEDDQCPHGYYMASLFIHPKEGFHFYRRDHACFDNHTHLCWSHKPGIMEATDVDASGEKIKSVLKADRNYGMLNYSELCSFFCVPENSVAATYSDSRKF